jgi:hypothetical protein
MCRLPLTKFGNLGKEGMSSTVVIGDGHVLWFRPGIPTTLDVGGLHSKNGLGKLKTYPKNN